MFIQRKGDQEKPLYKRSVGDRKARERHPKPHLRSFVSAAVRLGPFYIP
jgi:hypothetical protein